MIEINLLPEELKLKRRGVNVQANYFIYAVPLILGILVCMHIFLAVVTINKNSQLRTLNNKWRSLEPQRKVLENFNNEYAIVSEDSKAIQRLTEQRINWAQSLNKLSLDLPSGVWFNELSISYGDFMLSGSVVSLQKEEMGLINKFIYNLKNEPVFFKGFNNLELSSVQRKTIGGYDILDFVLEGILKSK